MKHSLSQIRSTANTAIIGVFVALAMSSAAKA